MPLSALESLRRQSRTHNDGLLGVPTLAMHLVSASLSRPKDTLLGLVPLFLSDWNILKRVIPKTCGTVYESNVPIICSSLFLKRRIRTASFKPLGRVSGVHIDLGSRVAAAKICSAARVSVGDRTVFRVLLDRGVL